MVDAVGGWEGRGEGGGGGGGVELEIVSGDRGGEKGGVGLLVGVSKWIFG